MHIMFFSTSDVFEAEEKINDAGLKCKIVPTPVTDKAYCGVCVQTENQGALAVVEGIEFRIVD